MDTSSSDHQYGTIIMPPPLAVNGSISQAGTGADPPERKRRRQSEETASSHGRAAAPSMTFTERVRAMEPMISRMLTDAHVELLKLGAGSPTGGDLLTCCALYTYQREAGVQRLWTNDYGMGKLEFVSMVVSGETLVPLPGWLDSRVELQVFVEKTMDSMLPHSTGFRIPWCANIRFGRLPADCVVGSVTLVFVNSDAAKVDLPQKHSTVLALLNEKLLMVRGHTLTNTADDLGVFQKACCYVRFRVPLRHLLREQLRQVRGPVPVEAGEPDAARYVAADNVVLRRGSRWNIKVDRRILSSISEITLRIFGETQQGKVSAYDINVSRESMLAFIDAAAAGIQSDVFPLDPSRLSPEGILELLNLACAWDFQPLKLWLQLTLLERLCEPHHGLDLGAVVETAKGLCRGCKDAAEPLGIGQKMMLQGLLLLLRGVPQWTQLVAEMLAHPLLKEIAQPGAPAFPVNTYVLMETAEGRKYNLKVNLAFWVAVVKAMLQSTELIPMEQQEITLDGKVLPDALCLADCNVQEGSTLRMKMIPL
ncbi:uncharacterized protein LOC129595898 [Paramacrobiotus metropolitanus]|uniref:uncharacterized protein LOC129595898 n=1 Tax=Paramacrobiotus metropolitanus TaxID=2943436 RepID=UPI0024457091|nr:uncharacterized protein LOC129595898 [Paramacrobiotus metropolitanus]